MVPMSTADTKNLVKTFDCNVERERFCHARQTDGLTVDQLHRSTCTHVDQQYTLKTKYKTTNNRRRTARCFGFISLWPILQAVEHR